MFKMHIILCPQKVAGPPYYKHWITHRACRDFQRSYTLDRYCSRYMYGPAYGMA